MRSSSFYISDEQLRHSVGWHSKKESRRMTVEIPRRLYRAITRLQGRHVQGFHEALALCCKADEMDGNP